MTPPVFNKAPPDPNYLVRKDLNNSGSINILDIVLLTPPVFNKNCAPQDAAVDCTLVVAFVSGSWNLDASDCPGAGVNTAVLPDVSVPFSGMCDPAAPGTEQAKVRLVVTQNVADKDNVKATARCANNTPTVSLGPEAAEGPPANVHTSSRKSGAGSGNFLCEADATDLGAANNLIYGIRCWLWQIP